MYRYTPANPATNAPRFRINRLSGTIQYQSSSGMWLAYSAGESTRSGTLVTPGTPNTPGNASQLKRSGDEIKQMHETTKKAVDKELERIQSN
jgi:hypothetical protein